MSIREKLEQHCLTRLSGPTLSRIRAWPVSFMQLPAGTLVRPFGSFSADPAKISIARILASPIIAAERRALENAAVTTQIAV
ncbi:MAG TPA: hypothetical protein VKB38_21380 [Terracidiphilus sp.]|nr:hypothetical protein [Terracidiphilus sp.]